MAKEKKVTSFTTPILVVLLVVAAFLVGMMWTKIRYMEGERAKGEKDKKAAQASPTPAGQKETLEEEELTRVTTSGAASKGKKDAPVIIVEFSDYQCPFCKRYFDQTFSKIWEEYGENIRYIFHDYPLNSHIHAQKLAEAARCAGDQGNYWEMHDLLFEKKEEWEPLGELTSVLGKYAKEIGIDVDEFSECLDSGKFTQAVKDDLALGMSIGVSGTPTFFINGQKIIGAQPFENFKAIINAELAK